MYAPTCTMLTPDMYYQLCVVHLGTRVSLVLDTCLHFSRATYVFHARSGGLHQSSSSLTDCFCLPFPSVLVSSHHLCLISLPPCVHTLFNDLRSENAIIEYLSIKPEHRDMLFLQISFARFTWFNNVCIGGTCTAACREWGVQIGVISMPSVSLGWHHPLTECGFWTNFTTKFLTVKMKWDGMKTCCKDLISSSSPAAAFPSVYFSSSRFFSLN